MGARRDAKRPTFAATERGRSPSRHRASRHRSTAALTTPPGRGSVSARPWPDADYFSLRSRPRWRRPRRAPRPGSSPPQAFGLAGAPGPNLPSHAGQFPRDGLASPCRTTRCSGARRSGRRPHAYKSRAFTSVINESVCVTVGVTAPTCTGERGDELDLLALLRPGGTSPPTGSETSATHPQAQTSYQVVIVYPRAPRFETVVDEVLNTANCGGVDVTWSSDRPWAAARPFPLGPHGGRPDPDQLI